MLVENRGISSRFPAQTRELFLLQIVQTSSWGYTASYWLLQENFPRGWNGRSLKLATYLSLLPKLRMSGAINPVSPLYIYDVHSGQVLYFTLLYFDNSFLFTFMFNMNLLNYEATNFWNILTDSSFTCRNRCYFYLPRNIC